DTPPLVLEWFAARSRGGIGLRQRARLRFVGERAVEVDLYTAVRGPALIAAVRRAWFVLSAALGDEGVVTVEKLLQPRGYSLGTQLGQDMVVLKARGRHVIGVADDPDLTLGRGRGDLRHSRVKNAVGIVTEVVLVGCEQDIGGQRHGDLVSP